jgi:CBS domain-containing protein
MRVREIMSSPLVTVERDLPLKDVAKLLLQHRITGAAVVDDRGTVVGVVSQADLVQEEQLAEAQRLSLRLVDRLHLARRTRPPNHHTAEDVMTCPAITVEPQTSAVGAAWTMSTNDVSRLIVTDRGTPVGMVTRTDLVRAFARSDADVRREIVEQVLPSLDLSPNDVTVLVANGEVMLAGQVDDELQARWLAFAVRSVLGVVAVESHVESRLQRTTTRVPSGVES